MKVAKSRGGELRVYFHVPTSANSAELAAHFLYMGSVYAQLDLDLNNTEQVLNVAERVGLKKLIAIARDSILVGGENAFYAIGDEGHNDLADKVETIFQRRFFT